MALPFRLGSAVYAIGLLLAQLFAMDFGLAAKEPIGILERSMLSSICSNPIQRLNKLHDFPDAALEEADIEGFRHNVVSRYKDFQDALNDPKHSQYLFAVLTRNDDGYRWHRAISSTNDSLHCVVDNGDKTFSLQHSVVCDWLFVDNFKMQGGQSVLLQRSKIIKSIENEAEDTASYRYLKETLPFSIEASVESLNPDEEFFDAIGNQLTEHIRTRIEEDSSIVDRPRNVGFPDIACQYSVQRVSPKRYAVWLNASESLSQMLTYSNSDREELLLEAAFLGHLDSMRAIVDTGIYIDHQDDFGNTALIICAQNGYLDCLEYLLKCGSSVTSVNRKGRSALHVARHPQMVERLLRYGSHIESRTNSGETPLMVRAANRSFDVCQKLVDYGADLDAVDKDGLSARSRLISFGDERAKKVLGGIKQDGVE